MGRITNLHEYGSRIYRRLERSRWMARARKLVGNRNNLVTLLSLLPRLMNRRAFSSVLRDLLLLYYYTRDIAHGEYTGYRQSKLLIVIAVLLYVVSPLDFVPDWLPGAGFLDDVALVSYAVGVLDDELMRYHKWAKSKRA